MPKNYSPQKNNRTRTRGPLLWILIPLCLGYTVGHLAPISTPAWILSIGFILFFGFLIAWACKLHHLKQWKVYGPLGLTIISWAYFDYRQTPPPEASNKPQREVHQTLTIAQTLNFSNDPSKQTGFAQISGTPKHLKEFQSQKIYYSLKNPENLDTLTQSQQVKVRGLLKRIDKEPGFNTYLINQGIYYKLTPGDLLSSASAPNFFYAFCKKALSKMEKILASKNPQAQIYTAMLLGKKTSLDPDQKQAFKKTGSLHLFAISGLHVGVIAACLAFILRIARVPKVYAALLGLLTLLLYVQITGAAPSAMRAFLMVSFYWSARTFLRKKSAFSALLASALLALLINPTDLFNIGFQLSYAVVATIILYGLPLNEQFNNFIDRKTSWSPFRKKCTSITANLFGISLAANLGSAILTMLYFQTFAPGAIPLSMVLVPLASLVISAGCISLILGLFSIPFLPEMINIAAYKGITLMEIFIHYSLKVPFLFLDLSTKNSFSALFTLLIIFFLMIRGHLKNQLNLPQFYITPILILSTLICFAQ